jgi:hypothetical protein
MRIPLWFELDGSISQSEQYSVSTAAIGFSANSSASAVGPSFTTPSPASASKFNRPLKLKLAMFEFYSPYVPPEEKKEVCEKEPDVEGSKSALAPEAVTDKDPPPPQAADAAPAATASSEPESKPFSAGNADRSKAASMQAVDKVVSAVDVQAGEIIVPTSATKEQREMGSQNLDPVEAAPEVKPEVPAPPQQINYLAFLQCACMDEDPRMALQKAFNVISNNGDGVIGMEQLYKVSQNCSIHLFILFIILTNIFNKKKKKCAQVFHFGLMILEETNRFSVDQNVEDPYPMVRFRDYTELILFACMSCAHVSSFSTFFVISNCCLELSRRFPGPWPWRPVEWRAQQTNRPESRLSNFGTFATSAVTAVCRPAHCTSWTFKAPFLLLHVSFFYTRTIQKGSGKKKQK